MTLLNIPVSANAINIRFIIKFHILSAAALKASPETAAEQKKQMRLLCFLFLSMERGALGAFYGLAGTGLIS